jgi:hypothetical protein
MAGPSLCFITTTGTDAMSETEPNNFNVILRNVRRFRFTKEQVFRLWKCALKDDDKLVDAAIEKLYEEMIAFNPSRTESVIQLIIDRDDAAETIFRGLLRDISRLPTTGQYHPHAPWGAAPSLSTTQHLKEIAPQDLISSETTRHKSNDPDVNA